MAESTLLALLTTVSMLCAIAMTAFAYKLNDDWYKHCEKLNKDWAEFYAKCTKMGEKHDC